MTSFAFPVALKNGLINYDEALIVGCLYQYAEYADEQEAVSVVSDIILKQNINAIEQQRNVFVEGVDEGKITCYSKQTERLIEKNVALDLLARRETSDILIHGYDLLYGNLHPANLLPNVIENAKTIILNNPTMFPAHARQVKMKDVTDEAVKENKSSTSIGKNKKIITNKSNRDILDPVIEEAIKNAGNTEFADVYLKLWDLAIKEEKTPFKGTTEGSSLVYFDGGEEKLFTKNALGKRLKNRR